MLSGISSVFCFPFLPAINDIKVNYSRMSRGFWVINNKHDIFVSWGFPRTDQGKNFLNFENRSFEYVSFSKYLIGKIPYRNILSVR